MQASPAKRSQLSVQCFERADQAEADWLKRVRSLPIRKSTKFLYGGAWKKLSREAKMPGV
jgi:hypothetical protein